MLCWAVFNFMHDSLSGEVYPHEPLNLHVPLDLPAETGFMQEPT